MGSGLGPHGRTAYVRVRAGRAPWRWGPRAEPQGQKDAEHLSRGEQRIACARALRQHQKLGFWETPRGQGDQVRDDKQQETER